MTYRQTKGVEAHINALLSPLFQDNFDRSEVVGLIIDDVIADIDETADWSELNYDEVCMGDIEIALARVLLSAVRFNYTGE